MLSVSEALTESLGRVQKPVRKHQPLGDRRVENARESVNFGSFDKNSLQPVQETI